MEGTVFMCISENNTLYNPAWYCAATEQVAHVSVLSMLSILTQFRMYRSIAEHLESGFHTQRYLGVGDGDPVQRGKLFIHLRIDDCVP